MTIRLSPSEPRRHMCSVANRTTGSLRRYLITSAAGAALLATGVFGAAALTTTPGSTPTPPSAAVTEPMSFAGIVDKVKPAVVSIRVTGVTKTAMPGFDERAIPPQMRQFFKRFGMPFGDGSQGPGQAPQQRMMAEGSGFFISSDGYLVTNNHVVENADTVTVMTDDGKTFPAKVVGVDAKTDIALLKVDEGGPHAFVKIANSSPAVGDWVVAVGDPFGLGGTVTAGIISARGRDIGAGPYDDFLQVDAAINRGNSGGPDFNLEGQVVGVNTAIVSPSGGSVGVGFAIPAETVNSVVTALKQSGHVTRGFIGVAVQPVTADIAAAMNLPTPSGALVAEVNPDTPAAAAGLHSGDVITEINGTAVSSAHDLARIVAGIAPNSKVDLTYLRDGKTITGKIQVAELQDNSAQTQTASAGGDVPSLGLQLAPASDVAGAGKDGVAVVGVDPSGVGADNGVQEGDVILEVGGNSVRTPADVAADLAQAKKDGRTAALIKLHTAEGNRFWAADLTKSG